MRLVSALPFTFLLLTSCAHYADYTLPPLPGGAAVQFRIEAVAAPLIEPGPPGAWDAADVLNPSVVQRGRVLLNLYSGWDGGAWRTGLATSNDGVRWAKQGAVLEPRASDWEGDTYIAANGAALDFNGEILYWYQGGRIPRIGLARSKDGRTFVKHPEPVLTLGPRGSWDERGVADPYVIRAGDGRLYMYYLGQDRARRQRLGLARSSDGVTWEKLRGNPVLDLGGFDAFDEVGLGEPAVWESHGRYWMLYTGRDRKENRRIGLAESRDGVQWKRVMSSPFFSGGEAWNSRVACDPTVLVATGGVRVWYGGGDVARPDENLHGKIGLFTLHATLAK